MSAEYVSLIFGENKNNSFKKHLVLSYEHMTIRSCFLRPILSLIHASFWFKLNAYSFIK